MPTKHALLSASSAEKWIHCTPSARLEEKLPDTSGESARIGTLAHEIAELKLRKKFIEPMSPRAFTTRMNKLKKHELYQEEMQDFTDIYIDYITECAMQYDNTPTVAAEVQLDYSEWAPEGYGTGDCVMVSGDLLRIFDFKYGTGIPVNAQGNEQMRLYALGAFQLYRTIYDIRRVRMSIVQPRLNSITEDELSVEDLLKWAEDVVRPAAALAYEGKGECHPGEWCKDKFCKVRGQCRACADANLSVIEDFGTPPKLLPLLSNEEIGLALEKAAPFLNWFKAVEDFALNAALKGEQIPGWKVVEGRSNRVFSDRDAAFNALRGAGFDDSLLYKPKEYITLSAAEKLAGRAQFQELCGAYVVKPQGKPTIVPESDKRSTYNSAAADFANINNSDT